MSDLKWKYDESSDSYDLYFRLFYDYEIVATISDKGVDGWEYTSTLLDNEGFLDSDNLEDAQLEMLDLIEQHYQDEINYYEELLEKFDDARKHCNRSCGEEHRQLAEWLQDYKTLKDKATPKLPYFEGDGVDGNGNIIYVNWMCPCCDSAYETDYEEYDYCPSCGQAILWGGKQ